MTITIAAIIGEAAGSTALIIPVCIATLIARSVAIYLAGEIVDEFQMQYKGLYFLHHEVPEALQMTNAGELMQTGNYPCKYLPRFAYFIILSIEVPPMPLKISPLSCAAALKKNSDEFRALPVISEDGRLHGVVACTLLSRALEYQTKLRAHDKTKIHESSEFADIVMLLIKQIRHVKLSPQSPSRRLTMRNSPPNGKTSPPNMRNSSLPDEKRSPDAAAMSAALNGAPARRSSTRRRSSAISRLGPFMIRKSLKVAGMMDPAPLTVLVDTPIERVYDVFVKMNLYMIVVVDTNMKLRGVITRDRLIQLSGFAKHLNEASFGKHWPMRFSRIKRKISIVAPLIRGTRRKRSANDTQTRKVNPVGGPQELATAQNSSADSSPEITQISSFHN
jgi:CBS domain-containing protein